jgi:hypothetical protein
VHDLFLAGNYDKQLKYILHLSISQGSRRNHEETCSLIIVMWIIRVNLFELLIYFSWLVKDIVCNPSYMASIRCLVYYKTGKALVHMAVPKFAGGVFKVY